MTDPSRPRYALYSHLLCWGSQFVLEDDELDVVKTRAEVEQSGFTNPELGDRQEWDYSHASVGRICIKTLQRDNAPLDVWHYIIDREVAHGVAD